MEVRAGEGWEKPIPAGGNVAGEFWAAAARGRLLIQHCPTCGARQFYPRLLCSTCGSEPEWEEASGNGIVHTFTVVRQNGARPFNEDVPYVVAMIELAEGPRMMGNVTGCAPEQVTVGMAVRAFAVRIEDDLAIPFWEPA
jgi:uncharacterized OB-fold protein